MNEDLVIERRQVPKNHTLSLLQDIRVEWGTKADWGALCELHYKGHTLAAGSRFMRCVLDTGTGAPQLIGVMVFANPQILDSGRNEVFPRLKPNVNGRDNRTINQSRVAWINKNMTWNNRTVLDTMYRSAGIAYRFKNLAYRLYCCRHKLRYVESRSSMGRFNPFSSRSGMRFIKPKAANALGKGVQFMTANFKSAPYDVVAIRDEIESTPPEQQALLVQRLREFYWKNSSMEKSGDKMDLGMSRVNELPLDYILKQTMQLVFSATIYWIWENPDRGRTLPETLPILAFDRQGLYEPLNLEGLACAD